MEDLCFNAQQAVEKAIKGVLIKFGVEFPYTHDIAELLTLVQNLVHHLPGFLTRSAALSRYGIVTRYPHLLPPTSQGDYEEAIRLADRVVRWAENIILNQGETRS